MEQLIKWNELENLIRKIYFQNKGDIISEDEDYYLDRKISNLKNQILKIKDKKRELKRRRQRAKQMEKTRIRNQNQREKIKSQKERNSKS